MKPLPSLFSRRLSALAAIAVYTLGCTQALLAHDSPASSYPTLEALKPAKPVPPPADYPRVNALRAKADPSEPMDEALGGRTLHGTPITPRVPECFPAEYRDLFWQMDMVPGDDGKLHPLNFDRDGNGQLTDANPLLPDANNERDPIRGRNTWLLWGGGNEAFWNWLGQEGYALNDYLAILDSRHRIGRFKRAGMINQPGFLPNSDPTKRVLGLYLDLPDADALRVLRGSPVWDKKNSRPVPVPADHAGMTQLFEPGLEADGSKAMYDEARKYLASMGDGLDYSIYGYPSGVFGLRLFLNPDFFGLGEYAQKAREYWKKQVMGEHGRYYTARETFADTALVRPFRVSMSCGFCHVAAHPLCPPADPENPQWQNLSSNIGDQYWKPKTAFGNLQQPNSLLYHFLASQQPGTVDTSAISTDQINNANTINAVFAINARLIRAGLNPPELQSAANVRLMSIEDPGLVARGDGTDYRHTTRVLVDGSDSIGAFGALARVYLNIGTYYEEWIRTNNAVLGFKPSRPFSLATCQRNSVYWMTNEKYRAPYLASFFTMKFDPKPKVADTAPVEKTTAEAAAPSTAPSTDYKLAYAPAPVPSDALAATLAHQSTQPMKLAQAMDSSGSNASEAAAKYLALDEPKQRIHGRQLWLDNCAICHSSKQPAGFALKFARKLKSESWADEPAPKDDVYTLPMDWADWDSFKSSKSYRQYKKHLLAL